MPAATLYERLGVETSVDLVTLRHAYRTLVKQWHPDNFGDDPQSQARAQQQMVLLNEAWTVLSDPVRRAGYDRTLPTAGATGVDPSRDSSRDSSGDDRTTPGTGAAANGAGRTASASRKQAWFAGVRLQMIRIATEAARSASLALALRRRGQRRAVYDAQIDTIVRAVATDVPERVRQARVAGAAPLDLGLAAALIGLRSHAARLSRIGARLGWTTTRLAQAEMVDRMWDTMAHGISHELATTLGGNPHISRQR